MPCASSFLESWLIMKYKAIIFDADGTLINSIGDLTASGNRLLAEYGRPPHTVEEVCYLVGNGSRIYVERILPDFDSRQIDKALRRYKEIYEQHKYDTTAPYRHIPEMLAGLQARGVKMAVFTNKHDEAAKEIISRFFPADTFITVVGDRPGVELKPSPKTALKIAAEIGVRPAECVFMGDTWMDMETAVNGGMLPVGVLWGFRKRDELENHGGKVILSAPLELFNKVDF